MLNEKQLEMARHALGFPNKQNMSNRISYYTGAGGDGYEEWLDMVAKGYAIRRTGPLWGGDDMFHMTLKGALLARGPKEHISRDGAEMMRQLEEKYPAPAPAHSS